LGFPEIYREKIVTAKLCANPGCYSTAVILGLYPLVKSNLIKGNVIVDAKSGVSGAGKGLKEASLYCEANESISSYATGIHRHAAEMEAELGLDILFSPHLVPMNRGILASIYLDNPKNIKKADLVEAYQVAYKAEPFIKLIP